jgi:phage tail protein X
MTSALALPQNDIAHPRRSFNFMGGATLSRLLRGNPSNDNVAPAIEVGAKRPGMIARTSHLIDSKLKLTVNEDDSAKAKFRKTVGSEIWKKALMMGVLGVAMPIVAPLLGTTALTVIGLGAMSLGAFGFGKGLGQIRKAEGGLKGFAKQNPEALAKIIVGGATLAFGVGAFAGATDFSLFSEAQASDAVPPSVPEVTMTETLEAVKEHLRTDGIDDVSTPTGVAMQNALEAFSNPDVVPTEAVENASVIANGLQNGFIDSDTPAGQALVDSGEVDPDIKVTNANPDLADDIREVTVKTHSTLHGGTVSPAHPDMADMMVKTADTLANDGNFANDDVAKMRLEAVVAEGTEPAVVAQAQTDLERLQGAMDAGVTNYTIQGGDNLTSIVADNDVYSPLIESLETNAEQQSAIQSIIEKIMELNPEITNPNQIFAGQDIVMPDLSGVDPATLEATQDWKAFNSEAGMSHYNTMKP